MPKWPTPSILPPSLETRPPLPELPLPEESFKTPEAAIETVIRGAEIQNDGIYLKGFRPEELDERTRARVLKLMPFFAAFWRSGSAEAGKVPGLVEVCVIFWRQEDPSKRKRTPMAVHLSLKLEQGEWRITGIGRQFDILEDIAAQPFFASEN